MMSQPIIAFSSSPLCAGWVLGAAAVTGYREDVEWREAPAFEVLMLGALCDYQRISAAENYLRTNFGELWDRLGVKIIR
ncbi:hypothetical protein [Candidatus Poriferisodalis sp.]|uniref:hypothetical protein n=1 Tax=Candidatus Poriferisodalis sp. TaxID=3101277 RepID=UPI003B5205A6